MTSTPLLRIDDVYRRHQIQSKDVMSVTTVKGIAVTTAEYKKKLHLLNCMDKNTSIFYPYLKKIFSVQIKYKEQRV